MRLETSGGQATTFEFVGASSTEAVVQAVAKAEDADPTEIPPLYNQIDPDALEKLFQNPSNGAVTFDYCDYTVTVRSDGAVHLE
jgi:hypothetical protein